VEGWQASDSSRDIALKVTYAEGARTCEDLVAVTVWGVVLDADRDSICAGGVASTPHQTTVTASLRPPQSGQTIAFSVAAQHESHPASVVPVETTTDATGQATTTLTSSDKVGEATLRASCGGHEWGVPVYFDTPSGDCTIQPAELEADGESSADLELHLTYSSEGVDGHSVTWRISRIWDEDMNLVHDPDNGVDERNGRNYGAVSPTTGTTDGSGLCGSTYTAGTAAGVIEIEAKDTRVYTNSHPTFVAQAEGHADPAGPRLAIYEPASAAGDHVLNYQRGTTVELRCELTGWQEGDEVRFRLYAADGNQWHDKDPAVKFWDDGQSKARYKALWDTSYSKVGTYMLALELYRADTRLDYGLRTVQVFALRYVEPCDTDGDLGTDGDHIGTDMYWASYTVNQGGTPTLFPATDAYYPGLLGHLENPGDLNVYGGYRRWGCSREKVRYNYVSGGNGRDDRPSYTEKYIWTYYAHLFDSTGGMREDNTGYGSQWWGSHVHFGVLFGNSPTTKPAYKLANGLSPFPWLYDVDVPFSVIEGHLRTAGGQAIGGARVYVGGDQRATTQSSGTHAGHYRVHMRPGTYTVRPVRAGWTFQPQSVQAIVPGNFTQDFTGTQQ
jgi:hypothetical protein